MALEIQNMFCGTFSTFTTEFKYTLKKKVNNGKKKKTEIPHLQHNYICITQ